MTPIPPSANPSIPSPVAGLPSAPVPLTVNVEATIPYPTNIPIGPTPLALPWVILVNSSPYALMVRQGGLISIIPAFNQDLVQVPQVNGRAPLTVVPTPGGANVAPGTDATVFATWYSQRPSGAFPSAIGAGSIPLSQSAVIIPPLQGGSLGPAPSVVIGVNVQPWMQAIAFRWLNDPAGNIAVRVQVADNSGFMIGDIFADAIVATGDWFYVPVLGRPVLLTLTSVGPAANWSGNIEVFGLAGPVIDPHVSTNRIGAAGFAQAGPQPGFSGVCAVGATAVISTPPLGYSWLVTSWSWAVLAAPAAPARIGLTSSVSLIALTRDMTAAAISGNSFPCRIWWPAGEGITVGNSSTQPITIYIAYEMWPTPLSPGL